MKIISFLFKIVLAALFPLSIVEEEVLSMAPEEALKKLQPAPGYEGLAVELSNACSIFAYKDEHVEKLVWNIKYKKSLQAMKIGGYALWQALLTTTGYERGVVRDARRTLVSARYSRLPSQPAKCPENSFSSPCVVIPMPITNKRRQERGYNQCELLLNEIERLEKTSGNERFIFKKDLLVRTHHSSRQTLKGRRERVESAKGIFSVNEETVTDDLKNMPIILIDDVITTGSTMKEALETLKSAGLKNTAAISLAH